MQIDSNHGKQSNIVSQQRYTYVANNQYKYVDTNGNFLLVLGVVLKVIAISVVRFVLYVGAEYCVLMIQYLWKL